jgi:16S rRNA processing protein RimM
MVMDEIKSPVEVGRFGSVYGVRGWIRIHSYTDDPENIFDYGPWYTQAGDNLKEIVLTEWKRHGDGYICKLEGFDQREESQSMTGKSVFVDESSLPPLPEDEFYINDLMGMRVINTDGYDLGVVDGFMETGANDVLVVKANSDDAYGKKERLLPLVFGSTITELDEDAQKLVVIWDPDF